MVLDLFLPPRCPACGVPTGVVDPGIDELFCEGCAVSIEPCDGPVCTRCGVPLSSGTQDRLCGECLLNPLPTRGVKAPYLYGGAMAQAIRRLKHLSSAWVHRPLGRLLCRAAPPSDTFECVVPVPIHRSMLRRRGFNQAELLGRTVAACGKRPLLADALIRKVQGADQRGLTRAERLAGVDGAFGANPRATDRLEGARILLVDDVVTTGATVAACTRELLRAGAKSVSVLAVARTPPPDWPGSERSPLPSALESSEN